MSRLVVISNRVGDLKPGGQSGGLAVAVGDALKASGGLWIGWNGDISDQSGINIEEVSSAPSVKTATFALTQREHDDYYLGYSNQALWPVCHYRLDLAHFNRDFLDTYRKVNRKFANYVFPLLEPDDIVWIHDYHLIPLAAELRGLGAKNQMGFFLHIPFPPHDIIRAVPENDWLLRSLFAYDLVGVQTKNDAENLLGCLRKAGGEVSADGHVSGHGSVVRAAAFPISIDVEGFRAMAESAESRRRVARLRGRTLAPVNIIGVDRLDYSKGLPDRFRAVARCMELYPSTQRHISLLQIAPPTREDVEAYAEIRHELESLSGAINGQFGDFDWTPIRYIHRIIRRETLASLYRGSRIGLVTPLRDGMNLVAKEYVAAQDADDPGVLILSEFAGAAEEFSEALLINPYDLDGFVDGLQTAISMRPEERRERHASLLAKLQANDIGAWRRAFLQALDREGVHAAA